MSENSAKRSASKKAIEYVQDGMIILLPQPKNYTAQLQGLHREIWEGVDTNDYISGERAAWDASQNG